MITDHKAPNVKQLQQTVCTDFQEGVPGMTGIAFDALHCQYKMGQPYTISGTGRNRVTGYRHYIRCALGDIEESDWYGLVKEVIQRENEQVIYQSLLQYLKDHNYARQTKTELEHKALELHADRIFDNQEWVSFLEFNRLFRPEALKGVRLVWIQTNCCPRPGQTTMALMEKHPESICCPYCGRWSPYIILTNYEMEEHKCV